MTGLRTGRTYVRTYGHGVITKFSELHGLLPFSLTNGCSANNMHPYGRWVCFCNFIVIRYNYFLSINCHVGGEHMTLFCFQLFVPSKCTSPMRTY